MSELFDKLAESAGNVIAEVDKGGQIQSAISGLRQRLAEADRKRKMNQVRQQIHELHTQEVQAINALSAQVLALHEAGTLSQPELVSLCRNVDEIRDRLREKEDELKQLQPAPPAAADEVRCQRCGTVLPAGAAFCQGCGARQAAEVKPSPALFCIQCGAQLRQNARFCPTCGQAVPS